MCTFTYQLVVYVVLLMNNKIDIMIKKKYFCIPIPFNNPLKVCFSNKKYPITIQTRPTQIVKVKPGFNRFLKIIGAQNQIYTFRGLKIPPNTTLILNFITYLLT
jgi:hypothetical protein